MKSVYNTRRSESEKNIIMVILTTLVCLTFGIETSAEEVGNLEDIFDYEDYLDIDYGQYENTIQIGEYYKVHVMGHHMVTEIGDISLKAYKVQDFVSTRDKGLSSSLTITETNSYVVENNITAQLQVKYGIIDMFKALVNLDDIGSVGADTTLTSEYSFLYSLSYSKTLSSSYVIQDVIDLTQIPDDKLTYSISRVAIYLEIEIISSYTEEHKWNLFTGYSWEKLDDTEKSDYVMRYYIADLTTFCYNDMTFGSKAIGVYPLNVDIKEYE